MNSQGNAQQICDSSNSPSSADKLADNFKNLNAKANVFVPGKNVFASSFVPTIPKPSSPVKVEEPVDDWEEDADDIDSTSGTASDLETPAAAPTPAPTTTPASPVAPSSVSDVPVASCTPVAAQPTPSSTPSSTPSTKSKKLAASEAAAAAISEPRKDHLNIVFIGHVDAGKSTIGGHIMFLTGMVDKRTLEKYEREAKEKNRESWYLSWALDTNTEEREKGKTVEVGRAYFETDTKHFTILDAPGHRSFVPNMIGGASQADYAVLVISARRGEFETGFERGGQTREHAMLVKTAGVKHLIIVVNKMDDPTVKWDQTRYEEIKTKLTPYLRKCGFNPKTDIFYIPVSGLTGANLKEQSKDCVWYNGPSLITYLDNRKMIKRSGSDESVRLPIVDRYKDMGTIVLGKLESGTLYKGLQLTIMPNKMQAEIMTVWSDEIEVDSVDPGANVKLKLKNVEEDDISPGFVLCSPDNLCKTGSVFDAQIVVLEHKSIICAGYSAIIHIHCAAEEVTVKHLLCLVDKKGEKSKTRPRFIKQDQIAIVRLQCTQGAVCLEAFKQFPQMGRFTLRDEGRTIGIGKVLKVLS